MYFKEESMWNYSTYNNNNIQNNDDHLFADFRIDDSAINLVNNDEIIGSSRGQSLCPFGNGVDYTVKKDIFDTESNIYIEKVPTCRQHDNTDFDPSEIASGNDLTHLVDALQKYTVPYSSDTNMDLRFPTGPIIHQNISLNQLSNITQDGNRDTIFLKSEEIESRNTYMTHESTWRFNFGITTPTIRPKLLLRFKEKKKLRDFAKKIRYASRKSRADNRKREKGKQLSPEKGTILFGSHIRGLCEDSLLKRVRAHELIFQM
ncbi:zinc finger protein CONSTANS-LIKE 12-like [Impatiens glandulifera]|uniref:zinc finger protein CONSTANS-LIKE 12-like n=1 Tax=Impatiens glandulifera TaxID=253017 RepID=UPI001FB0EEC8|nr:zinc finger protein CONSTANS-LIKE 12-like [Impatiens glandulifera]